MITNQEGFRNTVSNGLLDGMTVSHIFHLCKEFGSVSDQMTERHFLDAIPKAFDNSDPKAVKAVFGQTDQAVVLMQVNVPETASRRVRRPAPPPTVMLLGNNQVSSNTDALASCKNNALVGLNLLQEAISQDCVERHPHIDILDAGEVAAAAGKDHDVISAGLSAWSVLFSADRDGSISLTLHGIQAPSLRYFNDV